MTSTTNNNNKILHYYRTTESSHSLLPGIKEELKDLGYTDDAAKIVTVATESCFNVLLSSSSLTATQTERLEWLLAETFDRAALRLEETSLSAHGNSTLLVMEFGPRMTFTSAFSSNACSICNKCDLPVERLELSRRYAFQVSAQLSEPAISVMKGLLHDRMTEQEYVAPMTTFDSGARPAPVRTIPIMQQGRSALEKINTEMGLGFDDFDLDYYTTLFKVSMEKTVERDGKKRGVRLRRAQH
jgi:phosphoribosylformylglycinamidine synthase